MIKHDPQRKAIRLIFVILGLLLSGVVIMFGIIYATDPSAQHDIFAFLILELLLCSLIVVIMFLALSLLKRIDKRRAQAMQGDPTMLAADQPVPNEVALAVPTTIQLKAAGGYLLFMNGTMVIMAVAAVGLILFFSISASIPFIDLIIIVGIVLVIFLLAALMIAAASFLVRRLIRYRVDVNEQGITFNYTILKSHIDWSAASLFTVNAVKKAKRPKMYELSNSDIIVRWIWVPRDVYFFYPFKPELPYEQYDQQMQALLEFVAAKTHLPLYDISEPVARWYM
jgi:cell division protein FtsW (lipid II flippase)